MDLKPGWARAGILLVVVLVAARIWGCAPMEEPAKETIEEPPTLDIAEYPQFPWPPPRASATEVIPRTLLAPGAGATYLRDVDRRLSAALDRKGYTEKSYFAVPDGFALVTRIEQIGEDGTPKNDPDRWSLKPPRLQRFSLASYLEALFRARPGHYRVIVFIVTPHPFSQAKVAVTPEQASEWLGEGLNQLPEPIGALDFSRPGFACTALVYEFDRPTESDEPKVRVPGALTGRAHLQKSGLWEAFGS